MQGNKRNILFIINPVSGSKNTSQKIQHLINQHLDGSRFSWTAYETICAGDGAKKCAAEKDNYDIIVAVGGDGTVNEVASQLVHSNKMFSIIPVGSGNGLARHFGIPLNPVAAIKLLNSCSSYIQADVMRINDKLSFNVSGIGFDAHIAKKFALQNQRGFYNYVKLVLKEIINYKPQRIRIKTNKTTISDQPLLVAFANSCQFGNNAFIAPSASCNDSLIDICIIRKMPLWYYPVFGLQLFSGGIETSPYFYNMSTEKAQILIEEDAPIFDMHIDGDPITTDGKINIEIIPSALRIIGRFNNPRKKYNTVSEQIAETAF